MAAKSSTPSFTIPGSGVSLPPGAEVAVFDKGITLFEGLKLNGEIELKLADGTTKKGVVKGLKVDTLVDLLQFFGPQSVYSYGRVYTAVGLIQALTEAAGVEVLDVTKLYTAVVVSIPYDVQMAA